MFEEPLEAIRRDYLKRIGKIVVPRDLASAHHLIRKLLSEEETRRAAQIGKSYVSWYDAPRFDSPFEQRRLRILNALFLACGRQGAKPEARGRKVRSVGLTIHDRYLAIGVESEGDLKKGHDEYDRVERPASTPMRIALFTGNSGRSYSLSWGDTDGAKLEDRIAEIAAEMFVQAEARYRAGLEHQHSWRIETKARHIEDICIKKERAEQAERERLEHLRLARIDRLLSDADAFRKAQAIRQYVAEVAQSLPTSPDAPFQRWSAWALAVADDVDPVTNGSFSKAVDDLSDQQEAGLSGTAAAAARPVQ